MASIKVFFKLQAYHQDHIQMQVNTKRKLMKLAETYSIYPTIQFKMLQDWFMANSLNLYLKLSYSMPCMVCGYYLLP